MPPPWPGPTAVSHLAAIASVERGNQDWLGCHRVNLTGSITVLDQARRAGKSPARAGRPVPVVYASSAAVYGDNPAIPLAEDAAPRPLSAYGADKLGSELHARVGAQVHGVPAIGLRFFNVYGPRQDPRSPYSGVISIFCDRLRAGREVTIFGDGSQTRDFVYVGDVVAALAAAMARLAAAPQASSDVINVCTGPCNRDRRPRRDHRTAVPGRAADRPCRGARRRDPRPRSAIRAGWRIGSGWLRPRRSPPGSPARWGCRSSRHGGTGLGPYPASIGARAFAHPQAKLPMNRSLSSVHGSGRRCDLEFVYGASRLLI